MGFDKEELAQLKTMFDDQRSAIMVDMKSILIQELQPIRDDLEHVKRRLDQLFIMESEDVKASYDEINELKQKIKNLELRIANLER